MTPAPDNGKCKALRIAICGAGVGGLVLAARLARMGFAPMVFEARSEAAAAREGVFLTLAPNGMNGLRAIDAFEAVRSEGVETTGIEIRNGGGRRLALVNQSDHEGRFGAPSVTIGRGRLAALLAAAARNAGAELRFGAEVVDIACTGDQVRLRTSEGGVFEADLLVGADGLGSRVRDIVFPDYPKPRYTGQIGTGGVVDAPVADTGGVMRMTFGDQAFFGYLKAAGGPVYWFDSYAAPEQAIGRICDPERYARHIRALHADDPEPNRAILERVSGLDRNYPIRDMPQLPSWRRGPVVLIGDAAHAVGPHAGQGASMAVEDALVLAACLGEDPRPAKAFPRYERLRRGRVQAVVKLTARNGSQKAASGPVGLFLRDLLLRVFIPLGTRAAHRHFRYRADRTPLAKS